MSIKNSAAIAGIAETELENGEVKEGKTVMQIQAEAAKDAIEDAGLTKKDINGIFVAGTWGVPGPGKNPSISMAEYLGIQPSYTDTTNIGGSSFEAHLGHAVSAIQTGMCDVALILYGSTQKSQRSRNLAGRPAVLTDQWHAIWGLPAPVGAYAMAAMRHMHQYGTKPKDLAEIAISTREWATLNPNALKREALTSEDVLNSPMICDPLRRLDCCLITDGGGAIVVVSPERAHNCKKTPVWVLGHGESHSHYTVDNMPDLTVTAAKQSGERAFAMAGVTHSDIDVAEIYDSFTITVLLTLESLGFCKPGEGKDFVSNQRTAPGGEFPLNMNGGGPFSRSSRTVRNISNYRSC